MRISCGKEKWQMQLLYFITNRTDRIPAVLARLSEAGVNGATVVNCEGMAHMLATSGEAPAFFGSCAACSTRRKRGKARWCLP